MKNITYNLLSKEDPYEKAIYLAYLDAIESLEVEEADVLVSIGEAKRDTDWGTFKEYEVSFGEGMTQKGEIRLAVYESGALVEETHSDDGITHRKIFVNLYNKATYTFI